MKKVYRAKAPLRLGLGGGGSDLPAFFREHGGAILNATISMYAYASIEPLDNGKIEFCSRDTGECLVFDAAMQLDIEDGLCLLRGVYNRIVKDYAKKPLSFRLTTFVDVPPGSGLGSSSTLVVAMIGAFSEWLKLPLGEYDIARLAYEIERIDLGFAGGKQDQYSAAFGGFNYLEFLPDDSVIVNSLRIKDELMAELAFNLVLCYTSVSRVSSDIIVEQEKRFSSGESASVEAMLEVKKQALLLKNELVVGNLRAIGENLNYGWANKKKTSLSITNSHIDDIYALALKSGATGGKISGAGGGGFAMFYCPDETRYDVIKALSALNLEFRRYEFTRHGLITWTADHG
ncbi:GHMP family kinase ATP-binding protein [Pseudodesulfovibrio karagichevae]|uniref:D-glycero-alpha-D-manno-heptose-7-phosphate kinase n=1 Tax=Pseudodesulfovibrio karagichevae TaxID=3239305 RepID=A0ABV4K1Y9_9BACT